MVNFSLVLLVIFVLIPQDVHPAISDKRLCANIDCTEPIALAKTVQRYFSPDKGLLSVPPNVDVTIYSKSAGTNMDLWGINYNGKRGYIGKKFLKETKIFKKDLPFLVDTEEAEIEKVPSPDILPNKQMYEVVDGTTISINPNDISPSATEENVQPTESVLGTQDVPIEKGAEMENQNRDQKDEVGTETKKADSVVDTVFATISNFLEGTVKEAIQEDAVNEEESEETEDDDTEDDIDDENEEGGISMEEENIEEQPIVKVPTVYQGDKNEKINVPNEPIHADKSVEETKEEGESFSSRNLLQEKASANENVSSPDAVVASENKDYNINKVIEEDSKIESSPEISSETSKMEVTTESGLELPQSDFENVESVTPDPGRIDAIEANIDQKDNTAESNQSLWQLGLGENKKEMGSSSVDILKGSEEIKEVTVSKDTENNAEEKPTIEHTSSDFVNKEISPEKDFGMVENSEKTDEGTPENPGSTLEENEINLQGKLTETPKQVSSNPTENQEDIITSNSVPSPGLEETHSVSAINQENAVPENSQGMIYEPSQNISVESLDTQDLSEDDLSSNQNLDDQQKSTNENITETSTEDISENSEENIESKTENVPGNKDDSAGLLDLYNSWLVSTNTESTVEIKEADNELLKRESEITQEYESQEVESLEENVEVSLNVGSVVEGEKQNSNHMEQHEHNFWTSPSHSEDHEHHIQKERDVSSDALTDEGSCSVEGDDCSDILGTIQKQFEMDLSNINFMDVLNLVSVLGITGITVVIFLLGYIAIDKSRREAPLIGKINKLEKALLVSTKENQILTEKVTDCENTTIKEKDITSSVVYTNLERDYQEILQSKNLLEDQMQTLEKELENSTEVGLELNRMLSEILTSQSGSETLVANVEHLQRQLVEQQGTINSINTTLNLKDTENHELQLELEIKNKKVIDLQAELDKMALNLLKAEEEKDQIQTKLEIEIQATKEQLDKIKSSHSGNTNKLSEEISSLKKRCSELQKSLDLKSSEYNILKENFNQVKTVKNNKDILKDLLQSTTFKAELVELQKENKTLNELLAQERQIKAALEQRTEEVLKETDDLRLRYDEVDKEKLEAQTKLEVLGNYFKEKEAELQRELAKQESLWLEKQGEATSSTERIRYIQEELQNCKTQNELLKQEIVSQEVELKSQISVLEKKAHESWLSARQAERRLEDAKQEAAQLRNRLTLKERNLAEDKGQHRMQSPLEQNGDITSPLHMGVESPASPPLIYSTRDHLTTSPPLPGLPPFLPPPPGVPPFMPPPMPGVPGFMPPPPTMFPVDHRPPPLGRMSSPPLNSRYSPDSRYSPYEDRNSPSPPPFDDDYRSASPPRHNRSYSPYRDERRDYGKRMGTGRTNGRTKGVSSGSENSNSETIDRTNRHHTKI